MILRSTASRPTRDLRASRRQLEHRAAEPNEDVETSEGFGQRAHVFGDFDESIGDDGSSISAAAAAAALPLPAPLVLLPQPPVPLQHEEGVELVIKENRETRRFFLSPFLLLENRAERGKVAKKIKIAVGFFDTERRPRPSKKKKEKVS